MAPSSTSVQTLESLRDLINKSLDAVEQSIIDHDDPALTLDSCESHPIHSRLGADLEVALKTISSATNMLRALCDPNTYLNDTIYGVSAPIRTITSILYLRRCCSTTMKQRCLLPVKQILRTILAKRSILSKL
jgi:hypothetical protein